MGGGQRQVKWSAIAEEKLNCKVSTLQVHPSFNVEPATMPTATSKPKPTKTVLVSIIVSSGSTKDTVDGKSPATWDV